MPEQDLQVDGVPGRASGPQSPEPPLLLLLLPLELLLPAPASAGGVPVPHAPPRGTHALTWLPSAVESVAHASPPAHEAPPVHVAAQYVSPASCAQTPPLQSLSVRQGTHEPPELPPPLEPELPLLVPCPFTPPVPASPKAASLVFAFPEQAAAAARDTSPPSTRTRGMYDMVELRA